MPHRSMQDERLSGSHMAKSLDPKMSAMISCQGGGVCARPAATAPEAVRTLRTNATARTYLLSVPIRFSEVVNVQVAGRPRSRPRVS